MDRSCESFSFLSSLLERESSVVEAKPGLSSFSLAPSATRRGETAQVRFTWCFSLSFGYYAFSFSLFIHGFVGRMQIHWGCWRGVAAACGYPLKFPVLLLLTVSSHILSNLLGGEELRGGKDNWILSKFYLCLEQHLGT